MNCSYVTSGFCCGISRLELWSEHNARVSVLRNAANERQVITILELDMSMAEFEATRGR